MDRRGNGRFPIDVGPNNKRLQRQFDLREGGCRDRTLRLRLRAALQNLMVVLNSQSTTALRRLKFHFPLQSCADCQQLRAAARKHPLTSIFRSPCDATHAS